MSLTIAEVLENADYNKENCVHPIQLEIAKEQLKNYSLLIDAGYDPDENFNEALEKHRKIHDTHR